MTHPVFVAHAKPTELLRRSATTPQLRLCLISRAIVCAWSTRSGLWARDLLAHAMEGCSMKRKSIIYGIQSLLVYERTRTHERWLKNMVTRVEDC